MNAITLLCSSLLLFAASLRADTVIVQKVEGAGQFSEMTVKLKNGKALMEVAPQISTIYDSGTGDVITIMHAQKMYVKLPAATAKRAGVGFLVLHHGRSADYAVLGWWDNEHEMPLR